jgi:two-component system, sporulation sensor kinase E
MRRRNRLAWKLSVVVLAIVSVVIFGIGYIGKIVSHRFGLEATRSVLQFNSASIRSGINELMMSRNRAGVWVFIGDISRRSTTYQDISLVSHPAGQVVVSQLLNTGTVLSEDDTSCKHCHVSESQPAVVVEAGERVMTGVSGYRVLQVVTPILNGPDCRSADCHKHTEAGAVLGFLRTEYSLASFDALMKNLSILLTLAAIVAIGLCIGTLLLMFRRFLARPLRRVVAGIEALGDGDLDFRFPAVQDDEIGLVEDSFNEMADQIQAQQRELRRARDYMESMVENSADLIITVNTKGLIQTFNRGAEQALGYKRMEVIGQRIEKLFADPQERDVAIARLREQDNVTNWETRFKTKDDKVRHVLLTISRLRNRSGELIGTLGISKDITVEKDLQRKLFESEKAAAIGRAVTAIQHAVKNMLNTLRGGLYVLQVGQKKGQQERIAEGCAMIEEGLSRISDLSLNMLKYAREWKIEPEPVDLAGMIQKIVVGMRQTASERGVTMRTELDESLSPVMCDPRLIHMGLMDIVSNALDACWLKEYRDDESPEIMIRVHRSADNQSTVIEIQDNGIGMTQEVIENVFTPFFSTKKKWGTGLGLALTARIIDLHDGVIDVESEVDKGAVFRITLPLRGSGKKPGEG